MGDITLVTYSRAVGTCLEAANKLAEMGIECEVLNLRSLRPMDKQSIVKSVMKTHRVVSVDETWPTCGIGSEIAALLFESPCWQTLDAPFARITQADTPLPYAEHLEAQCRPVVDDVVRRCAHLCGVFDHPALPASNEINSGLHLTK